QLLHDERVAVRVVEAVDGDDVAVRQPRRRLRLAVEAVQLLLHARDLAGQDLDRHLAPERDLLRLEDHALVATPELAHEQQVAQTRAGPECGSRLDAAHGVTVPGRRSGGLERPWMVREHGAAAAAEPV